MTDTQKDEVRKELVMGSLNRFHKSEPLIGITLALSILVAKIEEAEKRERKRCRIFLELSLDPVDFARLPEELVAGFNEFRNDLLESFDKNLDLIDLTDK